MCTPLISDAIVSGINLNAALTEATPVLLAGGWVCGRKLLAVLHSSIQFSLQCINTTIVALCNYTAPDYLDLCSGLIFGLFNNKLVLII